MHMHAVSLLLLSDGTDAVFLAGETAYTRQGSAARSRVCACERDMCGCNRAGSSQSALHTSNFTHLILLLLILLF